MRIVITRAWSALSVDGVNTFIFELGEALVKQGHEVHIVSGCGHLHSQKLTVLFDVEEIPLVHFLKKVEFRNRFEQVVCWFTRGNRLLRKLNPELIIVNGVVPLTCAGTKIVVNHGLKTIGSYPVTQKLYDNFMYRAIGNLIAVSKSLKTDIANELGIRNVRVIPIGLDTQKYSILPRAQREPAILHIGTRSVKNLLATLKAFILISHELPEAKLYVTGGDIAQYQKFLTRSDMKNKICFLGIISRQKLRALYSKVLVVSAPSFYESFHFGTLEAFASGTPVVGSDAIPVELLIDGYNGYRIASPIDHRMLKDRLHELLLNSSKWKHVSSNARVTALKYDILETAKAYLDLAHKLHDFPS